MKSKHGGTRKGAGRKPKPDRKVMFTTKIDPGVLARFKAAVKARGETQAGATEEAMENWIKTKL